MIDLLLVDDQALVRTGMRLILNAEPDLRVTGEAGDGEEAVIEAERVRPDVVLMDIRMPKVTGSPRPARSWRASPRRACSC